MSAKELILKEAYTEYRKKSAENKPIELIPIVDKKTNNLKVLVEYTQEE